MTKKPLKKLWLFLISSLGITTITVLACSGGDWDGNEGSMFSPDIIAQPKYMPFFRTDATPFYDGYDDKGTAFFKEENIKDWLGYMGTSIKWEAVNYWLYEASINQIDSMIFDIKKKPASLTERSQSYSLKSFQPESKAMGFLYFLGFAKRNEAFAVNEGETWLKYPKNTGSISIAKQITGGVNFLAKATESFMKERYAFQLERLYFFNKEFDKAIKVYDDNQANFKSEENIKWRALSYKAGAFYKQQKYAQANYLFAKIYDEFEPLQKSAYLSFHPQQQADWNECLALAKTNREKEVLWQLFGLHTDNVSAMREILKLDPRSELADILLVRAVNIEEKKFSDAFDSYVKDKKNVPEKADKDLVQFLNEMATNNASANPGIWLMSAAYINYLQKEFVTADKQLKLAEKYSKTTALMNGQYHLISMVGKVMRITELNAKVETDLLADLKIIFNKDKKESASFRSQAAKQWVRQTLARFAEKKGEYEKAQLIGGVDSKRFENTENIKAMITYYEKANKSEFEKIFFDVATLSSFDYVDLLGIRYAQQDKLEDALRAFKSMPKNDAVLLGNPFTIRIRDCHDCDHAAKQKTKYTNTSFVEKLIEMKNFAATKPAEAAQNYFLIANGFYNMTYFGNARYFYLSNINSSDAYTIEDSYPEMNCDLALKYYLMAKEKSNDKEFQAKCIFMAAKCEQNKFFTNKPKNYNGDFRSGIYFEMLKKEYSTTKYHAEILKECSYYTQYAGN